MLSPKILSHIPWFGEAKLGTVLMVYEFLLFGIFPEVI